MNKDAKILILGANGLVGSSLVSVFKKNGYQNLLKPTRKDLDLLSQNKVDEYFNIQRPEYVLDAAAKVGGIHANNEYRADFIFQNLLMQNNIFKACFENKIKKFLFLGSSCIYPKECPQPIKEEYLLTGPLEKTNEPYAIAKIAGLKTAENFKRQYACDFFSVMPTNLYGENDNFHPENSHVIPALIQRMDKAIKNNASTFTAWGTGAPCREFLHVNDLAEACLFLMKYNQELPYWINVGSGKDVTIKELTQLVSDIMGFKGQILFDTSKPDGTAKKLLDVSKINSLGWQSKIPLREGLVSVIQHYKRNENIRSY